MTLPHSFPVSGDEFAGQRALVTGGAKDIGDAIVERFRNSGALVHSKRGSR
jgi:NAD(P)-dependent dehydrogenase (short-subunit alcohol dehydrogenase family)